MPIRHLLVLVCALLFAVAAPTAALAQSAGDNQYSDPFGSSGGGGGGGGNSSSGGGGGGNSSSGSSSSGSSSGSGGASSGGGGATASGSGTTGTGTSGTGTGTGTGAPQGPQLASTGFDTVLVALAGAGLLLCGVGLRLRTRAGWQR
jgi:hypothetical protein